MNFSKLERSYYYWTKNSNDVVLVIVPHFCSIDVDDAIVELTVKSVANENL